MSGSRINRNRFLAVVVSVSISRSQWDVASQPTVSGDCIVPTVLCCRCRRVALAVLKQFRNVSVTLSRSLAVEVSVSRFRCCTVMQSRVVGLALTVPEPDYRCRALTR